MEKHFVFFRAKILVYMIAPMDAPSEHKLQQDLRYYRQKCDALRAQWPEWQIEGVTIVEQLLEDADDSIDNNQLERAAELLVQAEVNFLFADRQGPDSKRKLAKVKEAIADPFRLD